MKIVVFRTLNYFQVQEYSKQRARLMIITQSASETSEILYQLDEKYDDIPFEVIVKQDILRLGLNFSEDSCRIAAGYKPKDYFIFSFDLEPLESLQEQSKHYMNAPEEIRIFGGKKDLAKTVISVRLNPKSPYLVKLVEGELKLFCGEDEIAQVEFHPRPLFYDKKLASGKKVSQMAPVLEWGYLIYLTVYRLCQYWGREEECRFCDINENYRQQKKMGREYTGVKDVQEVIEALSLIKIVPSATKAITITGGSITKSLQGLNEVDFYIQYSKAIYENFGNHWIIKAVVEAFDDEGLKKLKNEGHVDIYHPNFEIWDEELFKEVCPGKERYIGRKNWIDRILKAAEIFGPSHVIPNFVAGIEMAKPFGFTKIDQAIDSTLEGLDFFMSHGVIPRFTTWCQEPNTSIDAQESPPLEYFVRLLQGWRNTFEKYNLPSPPGYGKPGLGNAVFSVSAFMDVIRTEDKEAA